MCLKYGFQNLSHDKFPYYSVAAGFAFLLASNQLYKLNRLRRSLFRCYSTLTDLYKNSKTAEQ